MAQDTTDLINHMFKQLDENLDEELTEWEEGFIDSIKAQWISKGSLSIKQREILESIYTQKTK